MSDFKAKMHQIRFRLGLRPRPPICPVGAYSTPPDLLAGFKGAYFLGKGGKERGRTAPLLLEQIEPCSGDFRCSSYPSKLSSNEFLLPLLHSMVVF